MKIATWNVNGIRAREAQMVEWVGREQPDVVCLQEIKARPDQVPERCKLGDYHALWHGAGGYSGVSLHLRRELLEQPEFAHPAFDIETRIVQVALDNLVVASVYVPNGGKDFAAKVRFLEAMTAYVAAMRATGDRLVLCGDLNIALTERDVHPRERDNRVVGQRPDERALLERILDVGGLHDVGREQDPTNDALFTWWAPWRNMRQRNIGWRLDYVLASGTLAARAAACVSMREFGTSDHAPVVATFATSSSPS
jgi:exodeoxyribonuclease-3